MCYLVIHERNLAEIAIRKFLNLDSFELTLDTFNISMIKSFFYKERFTITLTKSKEQ